MKKRSKAAQKICTVRARRNRNWYDKLSKANARTVDEVVDIIRTEGRPITPICRNLIDELKLEGVNLQQVTRIISRMVKGD